MLEVENLTICYHRVPAVHHASFALGGGVLAGLLGPNGAGKTTLLKAIAGLLPYETGSVRLAPGASIAYMPQRSEVDWDFPLTVRGLVETGRYAALGLWKIFSAQDAEIVENALRTVGLEKLSARQIGKLSGGQQQLAFLARALAQQASIYLLDEPFAGLDATAVAALAAALAALRKAGSLVIASHHDLDSVPRIFDSVILLNDELVAAGSLETAFTPENIRRTYETKIFLIEETR